MDHLSDPTPFRVDVFNARGQRLGSVVIRDLDYGICEATCARCHSTMSESTTTRGIERLRTHAEDHAAAQRRVADEVMAAHNARFGSE